MLWRTASLSILIFSPPIGSHGSLHHIPFLYYHHKLAATADCVTFRSYIITTNWQPRQTASLSVLKFSPQIGNRSHCATFYSNLHLVVHTAWFTACRVCTLNFVLYLVIPILKNSNKFSTLWWNVRVFISIFKNRTMIQKIVCRVLNFGLDFAKQTQIFKNPYQFSKLWCHFEKNQTRCLKFCR